MAHKVIRGGRMNRTSGMLVIAVIGVVLAAGIASAFGPRWIGSEQSGEIDAAMQAGDFAKWKTLVKESVNGRLDSMTQDEFQAMGQRRQDGFGKGMGGHGMGASGQMDAVRQAIDANDYDAYVAAADGKLAQTATQEQFALMVQMHQARQDGDFQAASDIAKKLSDEGLTQGCGGGKGRR
ncbi:MAG: hypothetical protein ABIH41_06710 [Nanoarchaeota archaeon]